MEIKDYQQQAMTTCMHTSDNFSYMMLNLVGELGELASKVAKGIRKENLVVRSNELHFNHDNPVDRVEFEKELKKEAGDLLWQLAGLCFTFGWDLEDIGEMNLAKLAARKVAGTIDGNGDGISGAERTA